jgi:hypothetical protein
MAFCGSRQRFTSDEDIQDNVILSSLRLGVTKAPLWEIGALTVSSG